jgi:hypothetical protein
VIEQNQTYFTKIGVIRSLLGFAIQRAYAYVRQGIFVITPRFKHACLVIASSRSLITSLWNQRDMSVSECRLKREVYNEVNAPMQGKTTRGSEE